jgi:hypothetical protein
MGNGSGNGGGSTGCLKMRNLRVGVDAMSRLRRAPAGRANARLAMISACFGETAGAEAGGNRIA